MKKHLIKIIVFVFFITIGFLGYAVASKVTKKNTLKESIQKIPDFKLQTIAGDSFSNKNIKRGRATIFIYFNSECEYCQLEAEGISKIIDQFSNTQLLFISSEPSDKIKTFAINYKLSNYDNIHFLHDPEATFASKFEINSLPFSLIYNNQQKLIAKHKGIVKAQTLLEEITISELLK